MQQPARPPAGDFCVAFASQVAALSEPGGYFDTDNLISNERSYLQVMPDLRQCRFRGGAYVGVGPDQNFSYIAAVRPAIAFIIDIRRDNLLLHLLFKALFQLARTPSRVSRAPPRAARPCRRSTDGATASIEKIVAYMDGRRTEPERVRRAAACVESHRRRIRRAALARRIWRRSTRFHRPLHRSGAGSPLPIDRTAAAEPLPDYRELLARTGSRGIAANYLASEEAFQFVKTLHARDLIIPVIGNLSGPSALASIGSAMTRRGDRLAAFYASNVEFYLFGEGTSGSSPRTCDASPTRIAA